MIWHKVFVAEVVVVVVVIVAAAVFLALQNYASHSVPLTFGIGHCEPMYTSKYMSIESPVGAPMEGIAGEESPWNEGHVNAKWQDFLNGHGIHSRNENYVGTMSGSFQDQPENVIKRVTEEPISTFSVDVDTSSYSFVRRLLKGFKLPSPYMVKIEEMINYFDYDYPKPKDKNTPFQPTVMVSDSPWTKGRKLMHIGIKGYDVEHASRPSSNLVFLVDVSGSMSSADRLPLAKESVEMLLNTMQPDDIVSIVTYADGVTTVLPPTLVSQKTKILKALRSLSARGATFGTGGLERAYQLAEENFDPEAVNRILILTDGDFNVGLMDPDSLQKYVEAKRETGIFLSLLGFGMGNYRDTTMKALANHGNGVAAYIDSIEEAQKVMVTEAQSTIFPIAKDVKIQVEFNPAAVLEYRLVGYEKRILNREDFNNDKKDAGDIGSGHTVTVIYEFVPVGSEYAAAMDPLRYGTAKESRNLEGETEMEDEFAFLKIRYKLPNEYESTLVTRTITSEDELSENQAEQDVVIQEFSFATAVASFAQLLKGARYTGSFTYDDVIELANRNKGADRNGYRKEFVQLAQSAKMLQTLGF